MFLNLFLFVFVCMHVRVRVCVCIAGAVVCSITNTLVVFTDNVTYTTRYWIEKSINKQSVTTTTTTTFAFKLSFVFILKPNTVLQLCCCFSTWWCLLELKLLIFPIQMQKEILSLAYSQSSYLTLTFGFTNTIKP